MTDEIAASPARPAAEAQPSPQGWGCFRFMRRTGNFGVRDISFIGGLCLMSNNICGSAMVQLPGLFSSAGWVLTTLAFALVALWTSMSALYLVRTIASFPGNADFSKRWEYGRIARDLLPRWAYLSTVLCLCVSFAAQNVSNIIVSAQVMDDILLAAAKKTCALTLYPQTGGSPFSCVSADNDSIVTDSPFGNAYVVSIGFLIVLVTTIPLSRLNLDDNIWVQIGGMGLLTLCVAVWVVQFFALGFSNGSLPAFAPPNTGGAQAYSSVLPTVLFNYGYIATIPSWLNEKSPRTPVTRTLLLSVVLATTLYLLLGFFGAASMNFSSGQDLLSLIADGDIPGMWQLSKICTFVFPVANLMSSIPVFAIIVKYNLIQTEWMRPWMASALAIGVPWLLSLVFYSGNQLTELINWSSALLFVQINMIVPLCLYLRSPLGRAARAALTAVAKAASRAASGGSGDAALPLLASSDAEVGGNPVAQSTVVVPMGSASINGSAGCTSETLAHNDLVAADASIATRPEIVPADAAVVSAEALILPEVIRPAPEWWTTNALSEHSTARLLLAVSVVLAIAAISLQVSSEIQADTS